MGGGEVRQADITDRGAAGADQDGGAVDEEAVDQVCREKGCCRAGAAFDEEVVDVGEVVDVLGAGEPEPADRRVAAGEQGAPRRTVFESG